MAFTEMHRGVGTITYMRFLSRVQFQSGVEPFLHRPFDSMHRTKKQKCILFPLSNVWTKSLNDYAVQPNHDYMSIAWRPCSSPGPVKYRQRPSKTVCVAHAADPILLFLGRF